jgi:hypothetical protein
MVYILSQRQLPTKQPSSDHSHPRLQQVGKVAYQGRPPLQRVRELLHRSQALRILSNDLSMQSSSQPVLCIVCMVAK